MVEQFANNASSPLASSINASVTSLTVVSGTLFSTSGTFRVVVESEIMIVISRNANTLSVTRGAEGTIAAAHNSGVSVTQIMTAGSVQQFKTDTTVSTIATAVTTGTYSSLPSAGTPGRIFLPNNGLTVLEDNGTTWNSFGPILPLITPPTVTIGGNFSYFSQNGISASNGPGNLTVTVPFSATQGLAGVMQAGSNSSTMFVESSAMFAASGSTSATNGAIFLAGVMMVESATGKYCGVLAGNDLGGNAAGTNVIDFSYGQTTTRTSFTRNYGCFSPWSVPFVRMRLAGPNVIAEMSVDRQNWLQMGSVAITTAFTSAPNQVGFSVYPWELASGQSYTANFFHYNQG